MIWEVTGVILYSCAMFMSALSIVLFKLKRVGPSDKWNWTHIAYALQICGGILSIIPMTVLPLNILAMMAISTYFSWIIISAVLSRFILNKTYSMRKWIALTWISISISFSIYFANFSDPDGRYVYNSMQEHHKRTYLIVITCLMWGGAYITFHIPTTRKMYSIIAPITLACIYACNDMYTKFAGELTADYIGFNFMTLLVCFVWVYVFGVAMFSLYFAKLVFENTVVVNSVLIQSIAHISFSNMNAFVIFDARVNFVYGYLLCILAIFVNLVIYFRPDAPEDEGDGQERIFLSHSAMEDYGSVSDSGSISDSGGCHLPIIMYDAGGCAMPILPDAGLSNGGNSGGSALP